ncbi:MAG: FAD-dependent oxidoreductase [Chloroflexota bacterium]
MDRHGENSNHKIPGMLYILLSFVPWAVYWGLSEVSGVVAVTAPLAIALALVVPQLRSGQFQVMDLFSLAYFATATTGLLARDLTVFVMQSGALGFSVLSLMAATSLAMKKPFTLQAARRDYPRQYWGHPLFVTVNNIITTVWLGIFLVSALLHWFFLGPVLTIGPPVLIGLGIAFSLVFPLKAPGYLTRRDFQKYDWRVPIEPGKAKQEKEYDVILVGGGIGGLSCGALLARRGYKVLLMEQQPRVGGYCASFRQDGFVLNTGVEAVSGVWEQGPLTYLMRELGLSTDELFVKHEATRFIHKGMTLDLPNNRAGCVRLLSETYPEEKENIAGFFDDAEMAYREAYRNAPLYGTPLPDYLVAKVLGDRALVKFPKQFAHLYDWADKSFKDKLDEYFGDQDLKDLLCGLLGYAGTVAEKTPGILALTACLYNLIYGGHFPRGGAQQFADSLSQVLQDNGGTVLPNYRADRVLTDRRAVRGVRSGMEIFESHVVVANANARTTVLQLVSPHDAGGFYIDYIKSLKMSPSRFMVFAGVDMDLSAYPTLIKHLDGDFSMCINSNADPGLAPRGRSSITLLAPVSYHDFPSRDEADYRQRKQQLTALLVRKAEDVIPGLSNHIAVLDAATPHTLERYTSMPEGALYAFDQSIGSSRPYFKTPIRGLYLAGASTLPGGGVEGAVISGMICANDITGWKHRFLAPD